MNQTTTNDKYSLAERLKRVKKTRWIRFSIVALLYIGWTIWLNNYYVLFGLLLLIDIYLTQYIPWGWWKTSKNPVVRTVMEWVDAIVYALVLVYFIFIFVFQNYQIPSSSLEKSLLVGDFLLVSKMSYGPRVPNTPLHFPLAQHTIPLLLHRMAPMGLPPSQRIRPGETQRHRRLQLSGRRYGSRETTQPGLLHPVLPRRPGSRKPQQGSVRRYYLPSGRSSGKLCETMCGLTGRHVQHCQ